MANAKPGPTPEGPPPHPNPRKPRLVLPKGACDSHCHIYGPFDRFSLPPDRTFTPNQATERDLRRREREEERARQEPDLAGVEADVGREIGCDDADRIAQELADQIDRRERADEQDGAVRCPGRALHDGVRR